MLRALAPFLPALTLAACLAHDDDGAASAPEPRDDPGLAPAPAPRPERTDDTPAPIESSIDPPPADPADPDARDTPIPPTRAGVPPTTASLPEDGQIAREALALGEAGEPEKMRAAWLRLLRDHPQSPYVPLAYSSFGDHYFSARDFEAASKLYEKALQFPEAPVRAWALYMLAWCDLQRGDGARALERFVQTLRAIDEGHAGNAHEAETLAAATRRDLVLAYAIVGKPDKAAPFFQRLAKGVAADEVPPSAMLDRLGRHYTKDGKPDEAAVICKALKDADARATCDW